MKLRIPVRISAGVLAAAAMAVGCETAKSSNPLTPTVAGPIPGVTITAPRAIQPGPGSQLDPNQPPLTLLAENASTTGQRPLVYAFDVALDAGFNNKIFSRENVPQGENGRTSVKMTDALQNGRTYYWRAKAYDGANTGPYSSTANFAIALPIVIEAPAPLSPIDGTTTATVRPTFKIRNAGRSGPVGALTYTLQVSGDQTFVQSIVVQNVDEQNGETTIEFHTDLPWEGKFYWRARANDLALQTFGPWSATQHFSTPKAPVVTPPTPEPGPSPKPGGPCLGSSQLDILWCVRGEFPPGELDKGELEEFIYRSVVAFNASGLPGGPYGRLRKTSGNNCGGWSCDIVCVGNGPGQLQYDVLIAEETPTWGAPISGPGIRIDECRVP